MKPLFLLTLLLFQYLTFAQTTQNQSSNSHIHNLPHLEIPKTNPKDQIVHHFAYTLSYSEPNEQASWVAYLLTRAHVSNKVAKRTNRFLPDPMVATGSATNADYSKSGFDRGHLSPAGDNAWSSTAMQESFYYSNMSPQVPSFNRGIWNRLEEKVREWAIGDSLYIATGGVLTSNLPTIGVNKVSVPKYFYKVVLRYSKGNAKGIGFIIPNEGSTAPLRDYVVTIDSVEAMTGIDFYPLLPDDQERAIEGKVCLECWDWR